jgi:acetoin utilization deacetylase AcuC-like enzyme
MTGDEGFQTVMTEGILPLLDRFMPQMLLISYGFDPHWRDPLGNLLLTAAGYTSLIADLAKWSYRNCEGRLMLVLEGGYDLEAAAACTQGVTSALLGVEWSDPLGKPPYMEGAEWRTMLTQAKGIWDL